MCLGTWKNIFLKKNNRYVAILIYGSKKPQMQQIINKSKSKWSSLPTEKFQIQFKFKS